MAFFGEYIRGARTRKGLILREAARQIGIVSPYLSRIESGLERPPSLRVLKDMARVYGVSEDEVIEHAKERAAEVYGSQVVQNPALQVLFKMVRNLPEDELVQTIREVCEKRGWNVEAFLEEIRRKKTQENQRPDAQLPRLVKVRDWLFAADVTPRRLSKIGISKMATRFLVKHGLGPGAYRPPTPIELLVDQEDGVRLRVTEGLRMFTNGQPMELGMSHWSLRFDGVREIHINAALDSGRVTDNHRLRFTVGHELFHCLEHLPRMTREARIADAFRRTAAIVEVHQQPGSQEIRRGRTRKSFVDRWIEQPNAPKRLSTDEEWREWQADYFSACVLMPEWSVREELARRVGHEQLVITQASDVRKMAYHVAGERIFEHSVFEKPLHETFEVSAMAMAIRLMDLQLVRA